MKSANNRVCVCVGKRAGEEPVVARVRALGFTSTDSADVAVLVLVA